MRILLFLALLLLAVPADAQTFLKQWSTQGSYVAVSPDGIVYVGSGYMQRFTPDGTLIPDGWNPRWGESGGADGVAIAPDGSVWEALGFSVIAFNRDGTQFIGGWYPGDWTGHFEPFMGGVAIDALGRVCLLDNDDEDTRIEVRSLGSAMILSYFMAGGRAIAADHLGNLYVGNVYNNGVTMYSSTGAVLAAWGGAGSGPGEFTGMGGIAVAPDGNIYVVDSGNCRVQVFSPRGTYLGQFGTKGTGPGQFVSPSSIAFDATGNAYVTDTGRVEKFATTDPTPARTSTWGHLKAEYR